MDSSAPRPPKRHVSFATVANAWQMNLIESMIKRGEDGDTLLTLHPRDFVEGDLEATETAVYANLDSFEQTPRETETELRLRVLREDNVAPPPLWISSERLLGAPEADERMLLKFTVSTNLEKEVVLLECYTNLVLHDDEEQVLSGASTDIAHLVQARRKAMGAGATILGTRESNGNRRFRIVRELRRDDLEFQVVMADPSSHDVPLNQVTDFARLAADIKRLVVAGYEDANEARNSASSQSGGCYIATAVYGSYEAPEVLVFRRFRDERLGTSVLGRLVIRLYYAVSPTLAARLRNARVANRVVKRVLDAIVGTLDG